MSMTRRRFVGFTVGAAFGTAFGISGGGALSRLTYGGDTPVYPLGGPEKFGLALCRECPGGCGVRVRCIGDRAVKIDGNPLHPVSGGRLCPKGQAGLQSLYHPDRIATPLRRVGPRGSLDSFQPSTWDEAIDEIAVRLSLLRQRERPEALGLLRGPSRGVTNRIAARFMQAFGSPNDVVLDLGNEASAQAVYLTQGVRAAPAFDLPAAEYALSFGSSLLEASSSPVHTMRGFGEFRHGTSGRRGKLVHAGPRLSMTAASADEWIPVRDGTEGLLALGIAAVLVAENLYDREFVTRHGRGFEDAVGTDGSFQPGLRSLLSADFPLERVARECGVSVNLILRIAREFAAARPGVAIGPTGGSLLSGGLLDHLAAHVLNGLVGSVDGPGGMLLPEEAPIGAWSALPDDSLAAAGLQRPRLDGAGGQGTWLLSADPDAMADAILNQSPYRAEAIFVLDADPAFSSTAHEKWVAALELVPLVVTFAGIPTDTSLHADWILPTSHVLESWELDLGPSGMPFPVASLAAPLVKNSRCDARPTAEVLLDLAGRLGGQVAEALPWPDLEALVRQETESLFDARRGAVLGTDFDEAWVRLMERAGWWAPGYRTKEELWTRSLETGGWWDPFYDHWHWSRVLQTESGRFEFRPEMIAELDRRRSQRRESVRSRGGRDAEAVATLALHLFEPLPLSGGCGAELPFLQDILDPGHEASWETWVELHPETAEALNVRHGTKVSVTSSHGSLLARARVTERVVPGVAAVPVGQGKQAGGRWARGRGGNPFTLLSPAREPVSGLTDLTATQVRVMPWSGVPSDHSRKEA